MKIGAKILTLLVLCLWTLSKAQNYYLPDANFAAAIRAVKPLVLKGDSLIISEAQKVTGYLNLSNRNIYNADGIQYFSAVTQLDLAKNNLTSLPNLDHFTAITDFNVLQNKLTSLPKLSKKIKIIYAFENQLSSISNLVNMDSLGYLHVSFNNLTEIPDLNNFPNLTKLHCNSNHLKGFTGLDKMTKLKELYAWSNEITNLDGLSNNTALTNFVVYHNQLKTLPTLSNKPNLKKAIIHNNYLSFEDLYPLKQITLFDSIFEYVGMKPFSGNQSVFSYDDSDFIIQSNTDLNLGQLSYGLYTKNVLIDKNATGSFVLSGKKFISNDTFSIKISSSYMPALTLNEYKWTLNKTNCSAILPMFLSVLDNNCTAGAHIKLLPDSTFDPQYKYSFKSSELGLVSELDSSLSLENVAQGNYVLSIVANGKCNISKNFSIPNASNCDNIFSPNDDGIKDTYFFDKKGEIKILNTKGEIVKTLQGPATWDGKDKNGHIVPMGYYSIIIGNSAIMHLTVMK